MCNISLGTSGTIFISSDHFGVDQNNALHSFAHADGHYHLMGCMLSAASCNKWWMDEIIGTKDYAAEQAQIEKLGENHVYFLPYLMGERTPHLDPNARGVFFGLSAMHTKRDMLRAVLEGVTYSLRDCIEVFREMGISVDDMMACGGGGTSPLWRSMLADLYNCPVKTVASKEGPSLGVAILASVGAGIYSSVPEACDAIVKTDKTQTPQEENVPVYESYYQLYREIYPALKAQFTTLAGLQ